MVGAVVAAVSHTTTQLLIGRSLQGVGAAGPITLSAVVVTDMFPLRERAKWIGGLNAIFSLGSITGPIIGGALVKSSWVSHPQITHFHLLMWLSALDILDQRSHWNTYTGLHGVFPRLQDTSR
jgi:MFS family permease